MDAMSNETGELSRRVADFMGWRREHPHALWSAPGCTHAEYLQHPPYATSLDAITAAIWARGWEFCIQESDDMDDPEGSFVASFTTEFPTIVFQNQHELPRVLCELFVQACKNQPATREGDVK